MYAKRLMTCGRRSGRAWAQGPAGPEEPQQAVRTLELRPVMRHEPALELDRAESAGFQPASSRLGTKSQGHLLRETGAPAPRAARRILVAVVETLIEGGSDGNS